MLTQILRPQPSEYGEPYHPYIGQVPEDDILPVLESQIAELKSVFSSLSDEQCSVLHAPYTWTLKQVVGHCIDVERIFGYRAATFAAADEVDLPGFDQDAYVAHSDYETVPINELLSELEHVRSSNIAMFKRMREDQLTRVGQADGLSVSVRSLACLLVGHLRHHFVIVQQRLQG